MPHFYDAEKGRSTTLLLKKADIKILTVLFLEIVRHIFIGVGAGITMVVASFRFSIF